MLKDLQEAPILRYPDPSADYILYTDASKYTYASVLTQSIDGTDHPVAYTSRLFRGSQLNWAALTKEAYAIYMSVKKLSFYLDSAQITLRSDHLPLKKFLEKNTMNAKINNWAVELESQNINFEFIAGTKNVLADTLSRLIELDESVTTSWHLRGFSRPTMQGMESVVAVLIPDTSIWLKCWGIRCQ